LITKISQENDKMFKKEEVWQFQKEKHWAKANSLKEKEV
jgi:hypothetical protein